MIQRRTLLFLSAHSFHARLWRNGTISDEHTFADSHEGREQFAAFLKANRDPALLLTDLIEEDFRNETLPHLSGGARRAQHQRKFEQFYRNTLFRQAVLHRRQSEGRRDDEMLFSALTNPHLITQWLDIVHQQQIPLIGVYSVPTISMPLLKHIPAQHILLLSWEKGAGLRQSYFEEKGLYLSRLSAVSGSEALPDTIAAETLRTLQYLKNLSMLPPGEVLHVGIICHESDRQRLEQRLRTTADMEYHYMDVVALGKQFRMGTAFPDSDATTLLLGLLATKPPATQYAPPEYTAIYRLRLLSRRLVAGGIAAAAAGLLWGAANLWQSGQLNDEGKELNQQAQALEQQTQEIIKDFPHNLAPPADMKSAVTTLRALTETYPTPQRVWSQLSLALNDFPRIRIDHLAWQSGETISTATPGAPPAQGNADLQGKGMVLSGELEGWDGDYHGALDYLDHFQQALKQKGYEVTPLALPLDISPKGSIANRPIADKGKAALFSLKITWSTLP